MSALELLKSRQDEQAAQEAAKKAMEALWKEEQRRQLEPIKIAMRELAAAEPPVYIKIGSDFKPFCEDPVYGPLIISDTQVSLYNGYDSTRTTCTYERSSGDLPGCHFQIKASSRYAGKPQRFTDPIDAIDYLVGLIARSAKPVAKPAGSA